MILICNFVAVALTAVTLAQPQAHADAAEAPRTLTLQAAVQQALVRVPEVQNARERIRESDASVSQAYSALFPTLGSALAYSYKKDPLNIGNPAFGGEPYNFYDLRLTLAQPIFQSGALLNGIATVKDERKIRTYDLEAVERDTTLRVLQSFYDVMLWESRLRTLLEQEQFQKDQLKIAQDRFRSGRSRKLEVLQLQTQIALLLPKIQDARNQYQISGANLASLLGDRNASELQVRGSLDAPDWKKIERDMAAKVATIPELARNGVAKDQVQSRRGFQMAKYYPQLNAVGYWARSAYVKKELLDEFSSNWSIGVQLSIPLFSGLSSVYERRVLASQQAQVDIEDVRLRDSFALSQISAQKNLDLAFSQIEASRTALKLATEAVKLAKHDYRLGTVDYLQLFDAEQRYVDAEFGFDQAQHDAIIAEAKAYVSRGWSLGDLVARIGARQSD